MTTVQKQLEISAIDEAYKDQLGLLFTVLCASSATEAAADRFACGLSQARQAYDLANTAIGREAKNPN